MPANSKGMGHNIMSHRAKMIGGTLEIQSRVSHGAGDHHGDQEIREGIRRIGEVVREQVGLYGTLTHSAVVPASPPAEPVPAAVDPDAGRCAAAPAARRLARRTPRSMSRVAVLKGGRSLERQVSLQSGGRVEEALVALGHDVIGIDVGHDLVARLRVERPDVAFIALHGRDGEDGTIQELLEIVGLPYTGSRVSACMRCADKVVTKHALRDAAMPTPDFFAFNETAFKELGATDVLPAIEQRLGFPLVVKPADQGSALGIKFAAHRGRRSVGARRRVLLLAEGRRRAPCRRPRPRGVDPRRRRAAGRRGGARTTSDFYEYESRYEIGRTDFVCPADLDAVDDAAGAGAGAVASTGCSAAGRCRAST